jgi:hypothetical protein
MRAEKDTGQDSTNPHLLAARIIQRGGPITHHDINSVLAHQGHQITESELETLKSIPFTTYTLKDIVGNSLITALRNTFYKSFPANTNTPK